MGEISSNEGQPLEVTESQDNGAKASLDKQKKPSAFLGLRFPVTFPRKEAGLFQLACIQEGYEKRFADFLKHCYEEREKVKAGKLALRKEAFRIPQTFGYTEADYVAELESEAKK